MSSAARWTFRLPRSRVILTGTNRLPGTVRRVEQRRWLRQPPPRARLWAGRARKDGERSSVIPTPVQRRGQAQVPRPEEQQQQPQVGRNTQLATALAEADTSDLVADVHIPEDEGGVLPQGHPALSILGNSSLVIQRQIEMMNVMMGFEQANRYIIMDGQGQTLGYIAEEDHGIGKTMVRQLAKTHRSFTTHIFDKHEREVLRIHRPFAYINSRIRIYDPVPKGGYTDTQTSTALQGTSASSATNPTGVSAQVSPLKLDDMRIIGEAQQEWAPLRRKYNLFTYRALEPPPSNSSTPRLESGDKPHTETTALTESSAADTTIESGMAQFAHISEPFLSWDFTLRDESQATVGSVNRNFSGFAREIFTDTGVYALRMDSAAQSSSLETSSGEEVARYDREATGMTLDQRAVMLATAVSIDFDYFSRHSHVGGGTGFMPIFWPMGGGAAEGGAAGAGAGAGAGAAGAAGEAGAVGAAEGAGAVSGAAGRGIAGAGAAESGIAGAGTMAGYEAMQRGVYGGDGGQQGDGDDASPTAAGSDGGAAPYGQESEFSPGPEQAENRPGDDVWGNDNDPWSGGGGDGGGGGGGGDGGGGGWLDSLSDFFSD